jgi:hypothetical protein
MESVADYYEHDAESLGKDDLENHGLMGGWYCTIIIGRNEIWCVVDLLVCCRAGISVMLM